MWLFSKDRTSFPYDVDATSDEAVGDWILRKCKNTKTGAVCSAWVLDCSRGSSAGLLERGRTVVKRMKTLRHPNLLTYLDSLETGEAVTVVTEEARPLATYLQRDSDSGNLTYLTSWGLHQVAKALDFFNKDAKLTHYNVRMASVAVTPAGDWKLCGLDFVQPSSEPAPSPPARPALVDVYWPPDRRHVDSWGLGCLIWEVYNSAGLSVAEQLRKFGNIPQALVPQYSELVHPKAARRSSVGDFLSRASLTTGFFDNVYVRTLLFLEEIQLKEAQEKLTFLSGLADAVTTFPDDVARYKILPHLLHALQYGGAGAEVLTPLLRLAKLLEAKEFEEKVLPCLVRLFSSPDRATRVRLLEQLPSFVEHLPERCVNEQIFPPVAQGFLDTNPVVREATIRAMVPLAGKLSARLLNETLPRSLTLLQTKDAQGGIRANATICLAKLAGSMGAATRRGPLLNAFLKCTRDPYPPARRMAVAALASTLPFYPRRDAACKLLPCLAFLTVDPVAEVREETFRALRAALDRLETASADPEAADREEKEAADAAGGVAVAAAAGSAALAWTNWAVSALSAKFAKSTAAPPGRREEKEEARKQEVRREEAKGGGDFAPERGPKPASSYNWDGAKEEEVEFHDAKEEVEDEDEEWIGLEEPPREHRTAGWDSERFLDTMTGGPGREARREPPPAPAPAHGSRGAMKLGKKTAAPARTTHGDDWGAAWTPDARANARASPSTDDWGGAWAADAKRPADGWSSGKNSRASPSSDDWAGAWASEPKRPADLKKGARESPSTDDWGSAWSADTKKSEAKRSARGSPADDDWGSGWTSEAKKPADVKKNARESPSADDWGSSWSSGGKWERARKGKAKSDDDGWDAW